MRLPFSILRSPGSKGWFVPHAERFVRNQRPRTIVEPFAGSAVVGLTLLNRGYAERLVLAEKDPQLRTFWKVALTDADFAGRVREWTYRLRAMKPEKRNDFVIDSALRLAKTDPAFSVLLRSRFEFNGILRSPVSISQRTHSSWPLNLWVSVKFLYEERRRIKIFSDGFDALQSTDSPDTYSFLDPPYTFGKKAPGHKLYRYTLSEAAHQQLIRLLGTLSGAWQLTSEFCPEILRCLEEVKFDPPVQKYLVPMRTARGNKKMELVVSRRSMAVGGRKEAG